MKRIFTKFAKKALFHMCQFLRQSATSQGSPATTPKRLFQQSPVMGSPPPSPRKAATDITVSTYSLTPGNQRTSAPASEMNPCSTSPLPGAPAPAVASPSAPASNVPPASGYFSSFRSPPLPHGSTAYQSLLASAAAAASHFSQELEADYGSLYSA